MRFPAYESIEAVDGRITLVTALGEKPMAADLVLVCRNRGRPVQGIVVEPQRGKDKGKPQSCHLYQAVFWAVLDCPVALLMVCTKRTTSEWFAKQFNAGVQDRVTPPVVLDLDLIPVLSDAEAAAAPPEWLLLSLFAHGCSSHDGSRKVSLRAVYAALASVAANDPNRATRYTEVILGNWLQGQEKEELMSMLTNEPFVFRSEFFTSRLKEAEQAAAQAAAEAARVEGLTEGEGNALLRVLTARGFTVTESLRHQVMTCADSARIEDALDRAVTADPGQPFAF